MLPSFVAPNRAAFFGFAAVVVVVALGAAGCPRSNIDDGKCHSDVDCGQFNKCDPGGVCRCTSDDACDAATEFCNLAGSCQAKQECLTDDDCTTKDGSKAICDTRFQAPNPGTPDDEVHSQTAGQCVTLNATNKQCLIDSHCPFGFFCDNGVCAPGCRDDGDCPLTEPCINGACDPTPGACDADLYCGFGQSCSTNDKCQDYREKATLCEACRGDDQNDTTCPGRCLIDPTIDPKLCSSDSQCSDQAGAYCVKAPCLDDSNCNPGESCQGGGIFSLGTCSGHCGGFFCGSSSCDDASDPCPKGYSCFQLIIISNNTCTRGGNQCPSPSACSADASSDNNVNGACSCLSDSDCPTDPNTFQPITCVNPGPNGACISGSTCAPFSGLTCQDLR